MRHAEAVDLGEQGVQRDADRMLTKKGLLQASRVADLLEAQKVQIDMIVSSPLLRALQTAQEIACRLTPDTPVTVAPEIEPGATPENFLRALRGCRSGALLAVGHMPDLAYVAGTLMAGSANPLLDFKKASIAAMETDEGLTPGSAVLQWFVRPRILNNAGPSAAAPHGPR